MSIFSKLFSSSSAQNSPHSHDEFIKSLQEQFGDSSQSYMHIPFFSADQTKVIDYMMIHPDLGVILFNFFDYSKDELKGVTASAAQKEEKNAEIQILSNKSLLESLLSQRHHQPKVPVHSILICPRMNEEDFDNLDASFHHLIPKPLTLFEGSSDDKEKLLRLGQTAVHYDVDRIKQALFCEFTVPETNLLMSPQQQNVIHADLIENILIKGLPGSGKSSLLIAKSLYEKMKNPQLRLIIFAPHTCNVHFLQAMIFQFIEHCQWQLNPADITVSTFDSIQRRAREKERYDLVACDDINTADLPHLSSLVKKDGYLIAASHYGIEELATYTLAESFRLSSALCAACEGLEVDTLDKELVFNAGNTFMNALIILRKLLKEAAPHEISIVHHSTKLRRELCAQINDYFTNIAYLYDDPDKKKGLLLYPLSHITCLRSRYIIIIVDEESEYDPIELISRAREQSFILGESEAIYNIITKIKGLHNETD